MLHLYTADLWCHSVYKIIEFLYSVVIAKMIMDMNNFKKSTTLKVLL